jgi:hypothetical protein
MMGDKKILKKNLNNDLNEKKMDVKSERRFFGGGGSIPANGTTSGEVCEDKDEVSSWFADASHVGATGVTTEDDVCGSLEMVGRCGEGGGVGKIPE